MDTTLNTHLNPMPELAPLLKQLRLSGLLDTLAQRNREAVEGKLAYTEFLALVIQDEAGPARAEEVRLPGTPGRLPGRKDPGGL